MVLLLEFGLEVLIVEVYIDLNGKRKPNKLGIDHFDIVIVKSAFQNTYGKFTKAGVYF